MESELPDSVRELCARALRELDFETVAEIVDRVLHAASGFSHNQSDLRDEEVMDS